MRPISQAGNISRNTNFLGHSRALRKAVVLTQSVERCLLGYGDREIL